MKRIVLSLIALATAGLSFAQTDIANARTFSLGSTITITGVATNGAELGPIRYIEDGTAGIAAYGSNMSGVNRGDSVTITGDLIDFSGLLEISPASNVVNHGQAVIQPTPQIIPIPAAAEVLESQLVQVDNVTFVQTGNFAAGSSTYQVTDGSNTLDVRVNGSTNIAGTPIPTTPVSVIGPLGQFNANYQIVPRDLNDIIPYVAPSEEINVLLDGVTVLDGSTVFIGTQASVAITIENYGVNNLNVTGTTWSGTNAADFSDNIGTQTIGGTSSGNYTITYAPAGTGSRFATLEIANNDADENPYTIYFEAIGTDNLATEPTANPTNLTFPTIEAYTVSGQYAAGSGATNYLVLWKEGSAITGVPADGSTYLRGDVVGDAKVAYMGSGTQFTPRGVIANQDLYFAVYAFNGQGGYENYLTTSPLTGNVTTLGEQIGSYYNGIDPTASTFTTDLYNLINPHTEITYFSYKTTMMAEFETRDTTGGQSFVECALSGDRVAFDDPFDWTATGYSREHTFSHSWMPSFPADQPEEAEYNDQHNLYPANLQDANTPRSNLPLDDIDSTVLFSYLGGTVGWSNGQLAYEPREQHKGNAARAIMYMIVAYDFQLNGVPASDKQSQETLRSWHFNDLPDNYEIARNEYIYSLQGNRNPFVDSVDYACYIDFDNNVQDPNACGSVSIEEVLENSLVVFPVPSSDVVYVQVNGTEINGYQVIDLQGRIVAQESGISKKVLELPGALYGTGSYIVKVLTPYGETQRQMIIK